MHSASSIRKIEDIYQGKRVDLPEKAGVYAFWWIGNRAELMQANRHIVLKGPGGRPVDVEFKDWWPPELQYPCLYIGKRSEEHTSELQSRPHLVCRLLLEKKKKKK